MSDTISRQAAIDALDEQIKCCDKALASFDISLKDEYAAKVEKASLNAYKETLEYLPPAEPQRTGHWINLDDVRRDLGATCFARRDDDGELIALCALDVYADMRGDKND